MYLHLGQNVVVLNENILGLFDLDNTTGSHITRDFLNKAEKEGLIINIAEDIPKTFILLNDERETKIYLSQLAPSTLTKRSENDNFEKLFT